MNNPGLESGLGNNISDNILSTHIQIESMITNLNKDNYESTLSFLREMNQKFKSYIYELIQYVAEIRPFNFSLLKNLWLALDLPITNRKSMFMSYLQNKTELEEQRIPKCKYINRYPHSNLMPDLIYSQNIDAIREISTDYDLYEEIIQVNNTFYTPLDYSAFCGSKNCFDFFHSIGAKTTSQTVKCAIRGGSADIVLTVKPKKSEYQDLIYEAVAFHRNHIVEWFLNESKNLQVELSFCISSFNTEAYRIFSKSYKGDVNKRNENGWTPLIVASRTGNEPIVKDLLNRGAMPELKDGHCKNALVYASKRNHIDIVKLLLDHSFEDNLKTINCWTPLIAASYKGNDEIVKLLLEKGFSVDQCDEDGKTSLIWASLMGNLSTVKILVECNADINAKDLDGCQPLHYSAREGHADVCKYLISKGANINSLSNCGWDPLKYALKYQRADTIRELIRSGSKQPRTFLIHRFL